MKLAIVLTKACHCKGGKAEKAAAVVHVTKHVKSAWKIPVRDQGLHSFVRIFGMVCVTKGENNLQKAEARRASRGQTARRRPAMHSFAGRGKAHRQCRSPRQRGSCTESSKLGAKWPPRTRFTTGPKPAWFTVCARKDVLPGRTFGPAAPERVQISGPAASSRLRLFEIIPYHVMFFV